MTQNEKVAQKITEEIDKQVEKLSQEDYLDVLITLRDDIGGRIEAVKEELSNQGID